MAKGVGSHPARPAGPFLGYSVDDSVFHTVGEALKKYPAAANIFEAAIWRIVQGHCGAEIKGSNPLRFVLELPPITEARSPGFLIRFYYKKGEICEFVVDWVHYVEFDPRLAVSPAAYTLQ
jgi:hypothetical protein